MKKIYGLLLLIIGTILIFYPFFVKGNIPVPSDALVGMYNPFRDYLSETYAQGVPFKNFLITDSVRQIIPWKKIAIEGLFKGKLPLWNPFSFSGTPLLGNFQSSPFYPLNILLAFNFATNWGFFIFLQVFLGAVFLYFFLSSMKLDPKACLLASFTWVFSGYFVAWLEWGNILHTALWLPLTLFAINKILYFFKKIKKQKISLLKWTLIYIVSLSCSFFAGHLQTFFYLFLLNIIYLIYKLFLQKKNRKQLILLFSFSFIMVVILTSIQWLPFANFLTHSARELDIQQIYTRNDWFFPWKHLVNILIPDFYGNPTTLNYWGVWNYGEFAIYIGIVSLFFATLAIFNSKGKKDIGFYTILLLVFSSLALATPWAKLPFLLKIPLFSTAQPSRIIFLVGFCLIMLSAYGFDIFFKSFLQKNKQKKNVLLIFLLFSVIFMGLWFFVFLMPKFMSSLTWTENLSISRRNLIFPSGIFIIFSLGLFLITKLKKAFKKEKRLYFIFFVFFMALIFVDLFRFFHKFNPFTPKKWFYPQTKIIDFLKKDKTIYRIATTSREILPGNVSAYYNIQAVNGYDPLYLKNYAKYIAASEGQTANVSEPYGFNRIIEPQNINSPLINLLNVKYILSLEDLSFPHLEKVFSEGETKVYKNNSLLPRAYMVDHFIAAKDDKEIFEFLLNPDFNASKSAVLYNKDLEVLDFNLGENVKLESQVEIVEFTAEKITINTNTNKKAVLVLSEVFYPSWQVLVDGKKQRIIPTNFLFRGVLVPKGKHQIIYKLLI
ncbi:YfhO family protein [Patescibacteria group bacterium]